MATIVFQGVKHKHDWVEFPVYTRVQGGVHTFQVRRLIKAPQDWTVKVAPTDVWPGEEGPVHEILAIPPCMQEGLKWIDADGRTAQLFAELRLTARWEVEEATHSKARLNLRRASWPVVVQLESARVSLRVSDGFEEIFWPVIEQIVPGACLDRGILSLPLDEVQLWHNPNLSGTFLVIGGDLLIHSIPEHLPFAEDVGLLGSGAVHVHGRENTGYAGAIEAVLAEAKASSASGLKTLAGFLLTLFEEANPSRPSSAQSAASSGHSGQHG